MFKKVIVFFVLLLSFVLLASFRGCYSAQIIDYEVKDNKLIIKVALSDSANFIGRCKTEYKDNKLYLTFYRSVFSPVSSIGSKDEFEFRLKDSTEKVMIKRDSLVSELALEKINNKFIRKTPN